MSEPIEIFDTIIIGGGAAGLTTSIYAQRDRFNTLILEEKAIGGNAFLTEKIEVYPGFTSISGPASMDKMEEQARTNGAEIKTGEDEIFTEREHALKTTGLAQASQNGIFAAGDCREGAISQVATATGERVLVSY